MSKQQPTASQQVIARLGAAIAKVAVSAEYVSQLSNCPPDQAEAAASLKQGAADQAGIALALIEEAHAEVKALYEALTPKPVIVIPR